MQRWDSGRLDNDTFNFASGGQNRPRRGHLRLPDARNDSLPVSPTFGVPKFGGGKRAKKRGTRYRHADLR